VSLSSPTLTITVCLMLKAPIPGQVKTRLAASLGDLAACQAYRRLVEHQLGQLPAAWRIEVHGTPELSALEQWLGPTRGMTFHSQVSGDLGARMQAAASSALCRGAQAVVLLGGDCAELDSARLAELEQGLLHSPVVIIPALDGGYVALAMTQPVDCLFQNMPWSQPTLMQATRSTLTQHHMRWSELPSLRDVDEMEDWEAALPLLANAVTTARRENSSALTHQGCAKASERSEPIFPSVM
jgi:uncharacterized protein